MNQRRAAGSTGVAYIRWLLRARPADYMLALSVAGGSLPVVGKHLKPLGGVTAIGVWGARHASDFLSATAKDLLTPVAVAQGGRIRIFRRQAVVHRCDSDAQSAAEPEAEPIVLLRGAHYVSAGVDPQQRGRWFVAAGGSV